MIINSETTFKKKHMTLKKDYSQKFLKKISPFLGFDYQEQIQQHTKYQHITLPKTTKGISLLCNQITTHQYQSTTILKKFSNLIGNRSKINPNLYNKMLSKIKTINNPEEQTFTTYQLVSFFLKQYRPDLYGHKFAKQAIKYLITLSSQFDQEIDICRIVVAICSSHTILCFLTNNEIQFKKGVQNIRQKLINKCLYPKNYPQLQYSLKDLGQISTSLYQKLWILLHIIHKQYQVSFLEYLICQKFNCDSFVTIFCILLQSHSNNFNWLLSKQIDRLAQQQIIIEWSVIPSYILNKMPKKQIGQKHSPKYFKSRQSVSTQNQ